MRRMARRAGTWWDPVGSKVQCMSGIGYFQGLCSFGEGNRYNIDTIWLLMNIHSILSWRLRSWFQLLAPPRPSGKFGLLLVSLGHSWSTIFGASVEAPKLGPTNTDFCPIPYCIPLLEVGIIRSSSNGTVDFSAFPNFNDACACARATSLWEAVAWLSGRMLRYVELLLGFVQVLNVYPKVADIPMGYHGINDANQRSFCWGLAHFGIGQLMISCSTSEYTLEAAAKWQNSSHRCPLPTRNGTQGVVWPWKIPN